MLGFREDYCTIVITSPRVPLLFKNIINNFIIVIELQYPKSADAATALVQF
jgi:hypothetical protein